MTLAEPLLDVRNLKLSFWTEGGRVQALFGVSFRLMPGETLGLVGESGCGKSVTAMSVLQLLPTPPAAIDGGEIAFRGRDLLKLSEKQMCDVRGREISMIFQEPMTSLNPVLTVGEQVAEVFTAHDICGRKEAAARAVMWLEKVGMPDAARRANEYPHQMSGGMRQRAMIAMALLFTPDLVIMDEPTSALDVVAQRSLMIQIRELQKQLGFAVIFVTHDMSLVSHFSDQLLVMYAGQVVEVGPTRTVFDSPAHPYSRGLLDAFPSIRGERVRLTGIPGSPPDLGQPPSGCRFHSRCPVAMAECSKVEPELYEVGAAGTVGAVGSRCLLHRPSGTPTEVTE